MDARLFRIALAGFTLTTLSSGCASIVNGRHAQVKFDSVPQNAHVSVRDYEGREVAQAQTPAVVSLRRGRTWLRPADYTATIQKPGYQTARVDLPAKLNPWLFGNVLAGGVVGLGIDGATGAGWKPMTDEVSRNLVPLGPQGDSQPALAQRGRAPTAGKSSKATPHQREVVAAAAEVETKR